VGLQPAEQVVVLASRQVAHQDLVEMVMAVDQAGQDDVVLEVDHRVGRARQRGARTDLTDHAIDGVESGIGQFPPRLVHGDDERILDQQRPHDPPLPRLPRSTAIRLRQYRDNVARGPVTNLAPYASYNVLQYGTGQEKFGGDNAQSLVERRQGGRVRTVAPQAAE
jgi:hypothetical protein